MQDKEQLQEQVVELFKKLYDNHYVSSDEVFDALPVREFEFFYRLKVDYKTGIETLYFLSKSYLTIMEIQKSFIKSRSYRLDIIEIHQSFKIEDIIKREVKIDSFSLRLRGQDNMDLPIPESNKDKQQYNEFIKVLKLHCY